MTPKGEKPNSAPQAPKAAPQENDALKIWNERARQLKEDRQKDRQAEDTKPATTLTTIEGATPDQPAGALHTGYDGRIKKLGETSETKELEPDKIILRGAETSDIRTNARLLKVKKGEEKPEEQVSNLKEETARRMRAYTEETKDNWHTLDYEQMGSDSKGRSHEMHIGLGDILLDPDITSILVLQKDGTPRKATRGLTNSGRAAFLYDDGGTYAATYTGDKFRILDGTETDIKDKPSVDKYLVKLDQDDKNRNTHKQYLEANPYGEAYDSSGPVDLTSLNVEPERDPRNAKGVSEEFITSQLGEKGAEILAYAKESCAKFNIPFSIFKELIMVESGWKIKAQWENKPGRVVSTAGGLGQFLTSTWETFRAHCNANNIHDPRWGDKPLDKYNPFAMLYATAWLMNDTQKAFPNIKSLPIDQQGVLYYLAHHEGNGGAKKFVRHMNTYGRPPEGRGKGTVLAFAKRIARRAAGYEGLELKTMVATNTPAENGSGQFNFEQAVKGGTYIKERMHVNKNQKHIQFGSSILVGTQQFNSKETGAIAIGGASARSIRSELENKYIPAMKKAGVTLEGIIADAIGLQINGISNYKKAHPDWTPMQVARADFNDHLKLISYLKANGAKEVRLSTCQVIPKIGPEVIAFNHLVRTQSPDGYVDITTVTKSTAVHNTSDYPAMARLYKQEANKSSNT